MHTINTHKHTHACTTHHSPLKLKVVSDVSDLRPSPMDCAPMSPILLPVHPNTHNHINTQSNINTHIRTHHTSHITHHSLNKFSVVSDVSDLRPSPIHCAPMSPIHHHHKADKKYICHSSTLLKLKHHPNYRVESFFSPSKSSPKITFVPYPGCSNTNFIELSVSVKSVAMLFTVTQQKKIIPSTNNNLHSNQPTNQPQQ